ncbi:hypothetical protein HKX48_000221 [Thoreauomyces humboldtii]|nr:hypothetical protein HKX48_000221 [Thoreauomyces humboldtii]
MTASHEPPVRGALIVFEGIDRSGKTTQTTALLSLLQSESVPAHLHRFPDRTTPTGILISNYLQGASEISDEAVHLLFSANRWEAQRALGALLASGTTVVVDRYAHSGVAYSAAKGTLAGGLDWCKAPDRGLLAPDLIVFLDVDPEVAAGRHEYGGERYEELGFQIRVRDAFLELGKGDPTWRVVDAHRPVDEVKGEVARLVTAALQDARQRLLPSANLWTDSQPVR